jgi:hypothetical protein
VVEAATTQVGTCAVFGTPRGAIEMGAAEQVLPLGTGGDRRHARSAVEPARAWQVIMTLAVDEPAFFGSAKVDVEALRPLK